MAQVVKLKQSKLRLDLRGNNRFRDLLLTYVEQTALIAEAMKLKKEADAEIKEILGDAVEAVTEGFSIHVTKYHVDEHMVKASDHRRMYIRPRAK